MGWSEEIFKALQKGGISQVGFVPDAGLSDVISLAQADPQMTATVLTTEQEGIGLACGAWLGGQKAVLLMQSSGVGNCINMLSLVANCRFPFLTIVTMRGEWGEFNPWQVPMSRAVRPALEMMGLHVYRPARPEDLAPAVDAALEMTFCADQAAAILIGQDLIGRKVW
ncbi:MAG: phosphonopyruvate decarboxylase [Pseudomonadota bacterium]